MTPLHSDPEIKSFLDAIAAKPDDDTTRLVLADLLEERDAVDRADAIRRGVKKPKRFTFPEGAPAVVAYTSERPESRGGVVSVTLARGYNGATWTTYKGLIESVMVSWESWLATADEYERGRSGTIFDEWLPEVVLTTFVQVWVKGAPRQVGLETREGRDWGLFYDVSGAELRQTLLRAEWPQVGRWVLPAIPTHVILRSGFAPREIAVDAVDPQVGDLVRLADGTEGVLLAPIDADGYAPVRPNR